MRLNRFFAAAIALVMMLSFNGCLYLADTQQGNVIEPEKLAQLKVGQTQEQVRFLLGTPVVQDPLHPERWDYVFYFEDGETGDTVYERVTVVFDRGIVRQIAKGTEPVTYQSGSANTGAPSNTPLILDDTLNR